ncbi:proteinase-activated receptor 3 [Salmo trutta]|uniref:Coagulation factor II thrombin receptor like 2 n=1 Tax=Salmo trutta TaxID=8032 RepID=A0A674CV36_SALTR|nr:proteinase-activated receptor 3-like [Salmo trutta]
MGKLVFFLLVSSLLLDVTFQSKGKKARKSKRNITEVVNPRTFRGEIIQSKSVSLPNATQQTQTQQAPHSTPLLSPSALTPPALRLRSNDTAAYLAGPLSTRVIPCVYVLAVVVGIPANVAILSAVATKVRTVSSTILYCSLAVSDLFLLLSLVFKAHYHLHGNHWMFGEAACRIVTACFYGNLYCSAHTLACLSIKRYLAVVHPFLYKSLPKRACTVWASLAVWGVFGAAVVPKLLVRQSYHLPQLGLTTCHDVLPRDYSSHAPLLYYNLGLTILGLLVPLVVTAVCYTWIIRELNRSHHDWTLYVKASSLVFVIFVACFGPAATLHFLHYVHLLEGGEESFYGYFKVAVCLCCLHACLDPFLFLLMSKSAGSKLYFMTLKGKTLNIST